MLKPLPKEITDEIRYILEGCRDGKLKHDQSYYHCGTSHCIAGWKVVMDYAKARKREDLLLADYDDKRKAVALAKFTEKATPAGSAWVYAQRKWRLSLTESGDLFWTEATFPQQFALLERLEKGERIED